MAVPVPRRIIDPLLLDGKVEESFALCRSLGFDPQELHLEGITLVTASVLARVDHTRKLEVMERTGERFDDAQYERLLRREIFAVHPKKAGELHEQGIEVDEESAHGLSAYHSVFDLLFPYHPLSVVGDMLEYWGGRGVALSREELLTIKGNASLNPLYREREIERFFEPYLR